MRYGQVATAHLTFPFHPRDTIPGSMLDLQDTIGFALIGAILASTLYGLSIAQTVFYFKKYPGDRISLKMLVIFLLLVDTAKEVVIAQDAFFYLIQVHGNPLYLAEVPRSFGAWVVLSGIAVFLVQGFYISNIWIVMNLGRYRLLFTIAATILILLCLGGNLASVHDIYNTDTIGAALAGVISPTLIEISAALAADLYIATILCYTLHDAKRGFSSTESLLSRLITYAASRGLTLCVLQIAQLVLYIRSYETGNEALLLCSWTQSTLYVNSLLAALNARKHLRDLPGRTSSTLSAFAAFQESGLQDVQDSHNQECA